MAHILVVSGHPDLNHFHRQRHTILDELATALPGMRKSVVWTGSIRRQFNIAAEQESLLQADGDCLAVSP